MEAKIISSGVLHTSLPQIYVRPEGNRPRLSEVSECESIPIIDLSCSDRVFIARQIGDACRDYGFFLVINHGVTEVVAERMQVVAKEFFDLPVEEKMKLYSDDPSKTMRLSSSYNVKQESVYNWRDYLRLHCYPLEKYALEWPSNPPSFREDVSNYCKEVRELGFRLEEAIAESLGLDKEAIKGILGEQGQRMVVNYYPPCPEPELTFGLPAHTDPNALTILLQDLDVVGLQILKDGKWLSIKPHPKSLVVNIGDQLQALSNGVYKSVWHRAVVNANKPRLTVVTFINPYADSVISAPKALMDDGSQPMYRDYTFAEYQTKIWTRNSNLDHCLEMFKN